MSYIRGSGVFAYVLYSRVRRVCLYLIFQGKAISPMSQFRTKGSVAYVLYSRERPFCLCLSFEGKAGLPSLEYSGKAFCLCLEYSIRERRCCLQYVSVSRVWPFGPCLGWPPANPGADSGRSGSEVELPGWVHLSITVWSIDLPLRADVIQVYSALGSQMKKE